MNALLVIDAQDSADALRRSSGARLSKMETLT